MSRRTSSLLPALLVLACTAKGQDFTWVDRLAEDARTSSNVPGVHLAIVQGDRLVYSKAFGVASVETREPLLPEHLMRLGSTTKMMTAAALVILAQQGKVDLNAPVGKYVKDLDPAIAALTLHHLLSHTAGVIDAASMSGSHDDSALASYIAKWKADYLFTVPGKVMSYSNPGYHLAGRVLESVTGQSYGDAMEEVLFRPLGMQRTTLRPLKAMTWPLAQGHATTGPKAPPTVIRPAADDASQWPAGSVFTNVPDWSRLVIAFLNGGLLDGKQVLQPAVIETMTKPHAAVPGSDDASYGYGLVVGKDRGVRIWQHGGARAGYGSILTFAPDQKVAVFAIGNRSGAMLSGLSDRVLETLLKLEPEKQKDKPAEKAVGPKLAAELAGTYANGGMKVVLSTEGDVLTCTMEGVKRPVKLRGNDRLAIEKGAEVVIVRDVSGSVAYLCFGLRCASRSSR